MQTSIHRRKAAHRPVLAMLLLCPLIACQPTYALRGNQPDPQALTQIQPGKSTKADVTGLLGSPSSVSTFDPNTWYYISRRTRRVAFFDPELLEQKVYVVDFDDQGLVKDVQAHDGDIHDVAMNGRVTPAPGKELTVLEQLVGNFGRFNSQSDTSSGNKSPQKSGY